MIRSPLSLSVLGLGFLALMAGCAPAAQSEEPGNLSTDSLTPALPDPVGEYLTRKPLSAPQQADLLEAVRIAFEAQSKGSSPRETAERIDALLEEAPTLSDWRPLIRAELLARIPDPEGVERARQALDPRTPLDIRWGWRFMVESLLLAGDTAGAISAARASMEGGGDDSAPLAAQAEAGRLALLQGDTLLAHSLLESVMEREAGGPAGALASSVQMAARLLHPLPGEGSQAQARALGAALHAGGDWASAVARLRPLMGVGWDPEDEEEIRVRMGHALLELKRPRDALEVLPADRSPRGGQGRWTREALFWRGRAQLELGDLRAATAAFATLGALAPGAPRAEEGLLLLLGRGNFAGREEVEGLLLDLGVNSAVGEVEAVRMGTAPFLGGNYTRAATTFERYLAGARRPSARQQAAYWAALAQERLGASDRAQSFRLAAWTDDPLSFYGLLAGEQLGRAVLAERLDPGPTPGIAPQAALENALLRLRIHQILPTSGSFAFELDRLQAYFLSRGPEVYDFAEALLDGGFPLQGVVLGREIHRREGVWNLRLLRIVHPFPHRELIVQEARARGLDPFFVAGLIRQESLFHPSIRSSAGAVGLMQLMPATAREVARSLGVRHEDDLLSDPSYNIRLGTQFLASMLRRYGGRSQDALAAYNAGPSRASQWRARPEAADRDVFMEHIPFRETRNYVKVVQQYARIYAALYGCPGFQPCFDMTYPEILARSPYSSGGPLAR
jgi:hypothetical protein